MYMEALVAESSSVGFLYGIAGEPVSFWAMQLIILINARQSLFLFILFQLADIAP